MAVDTLSFRQTAAQFATGVTIIALEVDGQVRAMTANSFTSLSLDPPLVLFCLGKQTRSGRLIHSASRFCVNILGDHQRDLSAYFAGAWKAPNPPRYTFIELGGRLASTAPIAALGCAVQGIHEGGDHWIVIGEVQRLYKAANPTVARSRVLWGWVCGAEAVRAHRGCAAQHCVVGSV